MTWLKPFFAVLFCGITLFGPVRAVAENPDTFFAPGFNDQYEHYKNMYYNSQYVKKKNPGIMVDNALETFAAGIFLRGLNPILIVHDQPPLGRYILSLSLFLFDNPNTIMLLFLFSSLFGIYLISFETTKNILFSFIPGMFFANEPIFLSKFIYTPLLEPIQLPFIIFSLYCFIKALQAKNDMLWFFATSLLLGFVISTRFFALGAILLFSLGIVFIFIKKNKSKAVRFFITLPFSIVVLMFSYIVTMIQGYNPIQIIGVQKYMLVYHKSQLIMPFSFFDLLFFNRWHTWWGERLIQQDYQWIILWPISYIFSISLLIAWVIKKFRLTIADTTILSWIFCYSFFLSLGNTSTRYFIPLVPFLYVASVSFVHKVYAKYRTKS